MLLETPRPAETPARRASAGSGARQPISHWQCREHSHWHASFTLQLKAAPFAVGRCSHSTTPGRCSVVSGCSPSTFRQGQQTRRAHTSCNITERRGLPCLCHCHCHPGLSRHSGTAIRHFEWRPLPRRRSTPRHCTVAQKSLDRFILSVAERSCNWLFKAHQKEYPEERLASP
jgi:hypothetical protein